MRLFKRRSATGSPIGLWLSGSGCAPPGYTRLLDAPEIAACIDRISAVISSATIYLMQNTPEGDRRIRDNLSRFMDITPWPNLGTRQSWMSWIVSTMLGEGDGNAYVLPHTSGGLLTGLEPMPGAVAVPNNGGTEYHVTWHSANFAPDEILHFRLTADTTYPWLGRGYRTQAMAVAKSLATTDSMKRSLSSPDYKPPLIVAVNSDDDLSSDDKRETFRRKFLEDTDRGKPWILPADLMKVEQLKPLSLTDLAIKDTVELDKRTAAAIFGVPPFLLGLGSFNAAEYNNFVRTVILPICVGIEQELTLKTLLAPDRYWTFNRRRLYAYDLKDLVQLDVLLADRGFLTGDEVREDAMRDPAGLTDYRVLENYIPYSMAGQQKKLEGGDSDGTD